MLGFSRRGGSPSGPVKCDLINDPATGRDREPVRQIKQAFGLTCPTCGSEAPAAIGTVRRPVRSCADPFHGGAR